MSCRYEMLAEKVIDLSIKPMQIAQPNLARGIFVLFQRIGPDYEREAST